MMMGQVPVGWLRYERKGVTTTTILTGDDNDESWKMAGRKKISITSRKLVFITSGPNQGVEADRTHGEKFFFKCLLLFWTRNSYDNVHIFSQCPSAREEKWKQKCSPNKPLLYLLQATTRFLGCSVFWFIWLDNFLSETAALQVMAFRTGKDNRHRLELGGGSNGTEGNSTGKNSSSCHQPVSYFCDFSL